MNDIPPEAGQTPDGAQVAADLRSASDLLLRQIDRLYELESRKRELKPEDPEFVRLAREVQDVAARALVSSGDEERLADQVARLAKSGDPAVLDQAIEDVPPGPREAMLILADWRAAERRLAAAAADSDEEREARAEVDRLRGEYAETISLRGDGSLGQL
ncbi:MAG TPA: hypothetical protein VGI98_07640 [Candidatus Limnocylindrales bacterium]|jgi:hypothetical protein